MLVDLLLHSSQTKDLLGILISLKNDGEANVELEVRSDGEEDRQM